MPGHKPGPRPLPLELKKLKGGQKSPAQRRAQPPDVEAGVPKKPRYLTGDAAAMWKKLTDHMGGLGMLAEIDEMGLVSICQLWARIQEAERELKKDSPITELSNGVEARNPFHNIAQDCRKQLIQFMREFGLTPASRSVIVVPKKTPSSVRWDDL